MDMQRIGLAIADVRKKNNMTQEMLAEAVGVSMQAVSKWETGKNLPDIENLMLIAEITNTPYSVLLGDSEDIDTDRIRVRDRLFREENMFTRMKTLSQTEGLSQTFAALKVMRDQHLGQYRKKGRFSTQLVQYINHPLLMACQAHAFGIRDDALLSAVLLHDVVEDTDMTLEELPFSEEVKELVGFVTFTVSSGETKERAKELYYERIKTNGKACMIKILDRCNNVSTMAGSFTRVRLTEYIAETEKYVLPLCDVLKNDYPQYSDAAFLIKYHILSVLETIKNLIKR